MVPILDINAAQIYGLSANIAPPPLSALISLAMICGVDWLGLVAIKFLRVQSSSGCKWLRWQAPIVGAALLTLLLFPAALSGQLPRSSAQIIAIGLGFAGVIHISSVVNTRNWFVVYQKAVKLCRVRTVANLMEGVLWLIFVGLGLLALGPITEADALDYHVGVALNILNTGAFPFAPEWFHSRLAGSGEILIAIGLSIGAEQFGSILQYAGVVGFFGIYRYGFFVRRSWRRICLLSVVSSPVLIAWVASPKPMLLPIAMTTSALMLTIAVSSRVGQDLETQHRRNAFILICLLVMTATVTKFNFMLSGAVVGFIAFFYMMRSRDALAALVIGVVMATLIMAPILVWKYAYFGGSIVDGLMTPFPGGWPGTKEFEAALRTHRETVFPFPASLLVPSNLGTVTTVLGLGLFIAILALIRRPKDDINILLIFAALVVAFLGGVFGQKSGRFFIEPYLWLILAVLRQNHPTINAFGLATSVGLLAQSVVVLGAIIMGVATLTTGALTSGMRHETMMRHAMSYSEMLWADNVLPADAKLILETRFIALSPRYTIASDWRSYISSENEQSQIYETLTSLKAPEFLLTNTASGGQPQLSWCDAEIYAGPFKANRATRNPYNSGTGYDVWILRIPSGKKTICRNKLRN